MNHTPWWRRWLWCALPAVIAVMMYIVLPHTPAVAEYGMARGLFRAVAFPLEWLISFLPFSLTEIVVLLAAPTLLTLLVIWIVRIVRSAQRARTVERGCRFVAWCLSIAALMFMVTDGANFSRLPLAELMALPDRTYTGEDLYRLTSDLARRASAVRETLAEAQAKGLMRRTTFEQLGMGSYNIGWEIPGVFDCSMELKNIQLIGYMEE